MCGAGGPQLKRNPLGSPRLKNVTKTPLVLAIGALACHPFRPAPAPYALAPGRDTAPLAHTSRPFFTSALAAAGIPNLATSTLPPGYRELRLSTGHGMALGYAYPVLRILQTPTQISGEVWWVVCAPCRGEPAPRSRRIDWKALLRRLDSLEIATLEPPPTRTAIFDAGDLIVEALVGSSYRGYEVNAPLQRAEVKFVPAQVAFRIVDSVARLAPLH